VALISWAFKGIDAILIGNLVSGVPAPCRGAISTLMSQDDTQQLWPLFTADASELSDLSQAVVLQDYQILNTARFFCSVKPTQSRKDVRHSGDKNYPHSTKSTDPATVDFRQTGDKSATNSTVDFAASVGFSLPKCQLFVTNLVISAVFLLNTNCVKRQRPVVVNKYM